MTRGERGLLTDPTTLEGEKEREEEEGGTSCE
jgi:hypothetical protein